MGKWFAGRAGMWVPIGLLQVAGGSYSYLQHEPGQLFSAGTDNYFPVLIVKDDAYPVASDFDGDGVSDVLWRNGESGANAIWRAADYDRQMPITGVTNLDWQIVGTGDFDGDGMSGVVWRNRVTGANVIWRSARFADPIRVAAVGNTDWEIVSVADFNGNGKSDLLWRNKSTTLITIWESARHEGQGPTRGRNRGGMARRGDRRLRRRWPRRYSLAQHRKRSERDLGRWKRDSSLPDRPREPGLGCRRHRRFRW